MFKKKPIYLDYAAGTPVSLRVRKAMRQAEHLFANASALHEAARSAKDSIECARLKAAQILHGKSEEIIFCSGGTESVNMAILGSVSAGSHVVASSIEHSSVTEALRYLEQDKKVSVTYITPDALGSIDPAAIADAITSATSLVTVGYANSEIGVVQDIPEIGKRIKEKNALTLFHTDACQAPCFLPLNRDHLRVDLLSLDASKMYGPRGIGALFIKAGTILSPLLHGGGQERGLRPGSEPVELVAGFAEALAEAQEMRESETARLRKLQRYFFTQLEELLPQALVIGSQDRRLPNNVHICVPGINSEFVTIALSERGIYASPMSSCASNETDPKSKVLLALGRGDCASSSLRFSMGRGTAKGDIDYAIKVLTGVLKNNV